MTVKVFLCYLIAALALISYGAEGFGSRYGMLWLTAAMFWIHLAADHKSGGQR